MAQLRPSTDVRPVTEFRAITSAVLDRLRATKRPVILTQHGRSAAVLMDVEVYEGLLDEIALLRALRSGEQEMLQGDVAPHGEVEARACKARPVRVVWTRQAQSMLDEAVDCMAAERPASALRWLDETMERVRSLERFPDFGRTVPELRQIVPRMPRGGVQPASPSPALLFAPLLAFRCAGARITTHSGR